MGTPTLLAASSDSSIIVLLLFATFVIAIIVTVLLVAFVKKSKVPIAMGICGLGTFLMFPLLFTQAWSLLPHDSIPESISVPAFIIGFCLLFVGMFVWRLLQRTGVK